jgi:sugar phosphate isomerase/epimerase
VQRTIEKIQVNVPFKMLKESYLDLFLTQRLNPEIGLCCEALDSYSFSEFKNIADKIHSLALSVTLHAPFMDLSPGSPDPDVRSLSKNRFEQMLRLVPVFKPKTVVCHTGYDWKRYWNMKDSWIENSLGIWSWLGSRIRDVGSRLLLENVYEYDPDDILTLLRQLEDQSVGFCLDVGHQNVFGRSPLKKWVNDLGPYLKQLHLHDNEGECDDHLGLGKGNIDFQDLFYLLKSPLHEHFIITLEPHKEKDFRVSIEYLKRMDFANA